MNCNLKFKGCCNVKKVFQKEPMPQFAMRFHAAFEGGRVVVHFVYKNSRSNQKVTEGFCDKKKKPKPLSMQ